MSPGIVGGPGEAIPTVATPGSPPNQGGVPVCHLKSRQSFKSAIHLYLEDLAAWEKILIPLGGLDNQQENRLVKCEIFSEILKKSNKDYWSTLGGCPWGVL